MTALGVDLSVGPIRGVAIGGDGIVLSRAEQSSHHDDVPTAIQAVRHACQSGLREPLQVVGVATPLPGEPLASAVAAALADHGMSPRAIGAGAASALAEAWCGSAQGVQDVVTMTIGRHVAAGVLIGGQVVAGAHGLAASVGWLAINPVERDDYRRLGGLEAEVAAPGIVRRLVWRIKSGDSSRVEEQVHGDFARLTVDHVLAAARAGDGVCISVIRDTVKSVGIAVANLVTVLDPEIVVLGGTLATAGDLMLDPIRAECLRRLRPAQAERLRIVTSTLGADAVAIGAARAAMLPS